jgi:hypothetical protein
MREHGQRGRAPAVIGDVSEDDSDVYMSGIRETDAPDSWSLLFMEPYDAEDPQEIQLGMAQVLLRFDDERRWLRAAARQVGHLFPRLLCQSEYNTRLKAAAPR